jgi:hypothetical protein
MATTTNYGWTTPDDTALVKDGAAAIRTLGSSVDTTTKALNPETTLGDLAYRSSTANVKTRLGLGTAGQVLQVNSGATAPEWATVSAGGMTLINSGGTTLTGASVSISSIPATYNNLVLWVLNFKPANDDENLSVRFNDDSSSVYKNEVGTGTNMNMNNDRLYMSRGQDNTVAQGFSYLEIWNYANTTSWRVSQITAWGNNATTSTNGNWLDYAGVYASTGTAINKITILPTGGNFTSGTAYLYGVK